MTATTSAAARRGTRSARRRRAAALVRARRRQLGIASLRKLGNGAPRRKLAADYRASSALSPTQLKSIRRQAPEDRMPLAYRLGWSAVEDARYAIKMLSPDEFAAELADLDDRTPQPVATFEQVARLSRSLVQWRARIAGLADLLRALATPGPSDPAVVPLWAEAPAAEMPPPLDLGPPPQQLALADTIRRTGPPAHARGAHAA